MSIGKQYLSALVADGKASALLQAGSIDHLFVGPELEAFVYVKKFVQSYQALPKPETILAHTGETLTKSIEPSGFYLDKLKDRHVERTLKKSMSTAADLLKSLQPHDALKVITEGVMQLIAERHSAKIVDFRDAYDVIIGDYVSKFNAPDDYGLQLGWPTFDEMSGGLGIGDLISIVGRPMKGKTWQMLYAAWHGWNREGLSNLKLAKEDKEAEINHEQSRLFISMEMMTLPIQKRLAAMQSKLPMDSIKHSQLGSKGMDKLKGALYEIKGYGAPFWVVDGNLTATVEDIWMLARQLNPGSIHIDGAYLVKHPTEKDRFKRVAENVNLIKQNLCPIAPTVCSWQFAKMKNQKGKEKKADEKPTLEDIGYTDAIAQDSSIVLGLLEEDSVETLKRRTNHVLKGRNGEVGSFLTNWNFQAMDFTEVKDIALEDLSFV